MAVQLCFAVLKQASLSSAFFIDISVTEVLNISKKELYINEEIRGKELRVIDSDGSQLGILSSQQALALAEEKNLDLVMISPQAKPPVCKIMDYGKYRFEQARREKERRKNQKVVDIKEVRLSLNIDTHDFNTKVNQLGEGFVTYMPISSNLVISHLNGHCLVVITRIG